MGITRPVEGSAVAISQADTKNRIRHRKAMSQSSWSWSCGTQICKLGEALAQDKLATRAADAAVVRLLSSRSLDLNFSSISSTIATWTLLRPRLAKP